MQFYGLYLHLVEEMLSVQTIRRNGACSVTTDRDGEDRQSPARTVCTSLAAGRT